MKLISFLVGLVILATIILVIPYLFLAGALFYVAFKISVFFSNYFKKADSQKHYYKFYSTATSTSASSKIVELQPEIDQNGKVIYE